MRSSAKAAAWKDASAGSSAPFRASVSVDSPESVARSNSVSQLVRVSGITAPSPSPGSANSFGSTMSMNWLVPRGGAETHTTPRLTDSVQGPVSRLPPGSASAVGRGIRLAKRESASVMAVSHVSVCPASSAGSTSDSEDAGRRLSSVPGEPLATRLSVVPSPPPSSGLTPGRNPPASVASRCLGAASSTPSPNSTRNRLTAPRSMNQTASGSSSFTGRLPAHGTGAPERVASSASEVWPALVRSRISPT